MDHNNPENASKVEFGTAEDETLEETKSCAVHAAGDLVPSNTHIQLPNSSEKYRLAAAPTHHRIS